MAALMCGRPGKAIRGQAHVQKAHVQPDSPSPAGRPERGCRARPPRLPNAAGAGMSASAGEMAEWFKAAVLKTAVGATPPWVRIPLSPPLLRILPWCAGFCGVGKDQRSGCVASPCKAGRHFPLVRSGVFNPHHHRAALAAGIGPRMGFAHRLERENAVNQRLVSAFLRQMRQIAQIIAPTLCRAGNRTP
jgi:hypothetical protein